MFVTVPLLDLKAQYTPLRQELLDAVTRVCDSQRYIGGPEVEGLERELCDTLGYPHAIGLSSGTDAVLAALMAMDIGPGTYFGDTRGATNDGTSSCGSTSASNDVWYRYRPFRNEIVTISTFGSLFDTVLSVYARGDSS